MLPPSWEQLMGATFKTQFEYPGMHGNSGWYPQMSNTTYEAELGNDLSLAILRDIPVGIKVVQLDW